MLVLGYVEGGWPAYLPADEVLLRPYFENRDKIVVVDDILVYGDRLVIPSVDRFDILKLIHQGHLGITKCRERARTAVWWPGMSSQIADMVRSCVLRRKIFNVVRKPLIRSDFPNRPWERVGSDLFFLEGKWYLLVVDYFSRYVEVDLLSELSSLEVVSHLKSIFARHGIPEMLISDNGPQYSSEAFSEFTRTYNFVHVTSSPKHPQSNGAAERAVQTVKSMLKKSDDPQLALLAFRASPQENGSSPSELLMGRKLRTTLPVLPKVLSPCSTDVKKVAERETELCHKSKLNYDARHRVIEQAPLQEGDKVFVRDMQRDAEVVRQVAPRSYVVADKQGGSLRRSTQELVSLPAITPNKSVSGSPNCSESSSCPVATADARPPIVSSFGRVIKPRKIFDM